MAEQRSEIVIVREYQPDLHNQVQALLALLTYQPGPPMPSEPEMSLAASHHSTLESQRWEKSKQAAQRKGAAQLG